MKEEVSYIARYPVINGNHVGFLIIKCVDVSAESPERNLKEKQGICRYQLYRATEFRTPEKQVTEIIRQNFDTVTQQNGEKDNEVKRFLIIAGFLSFLLPGLGQLYNGQLRKAILLYILVLLIPPSFIIVLSGFPAFICLYVMKICLVIYAVGDALYYAEKTGPIQSRIYQRWYAYLIVLILTLLVLLPIETATAMKYIRTFYCPSTSMSPTLLVGDCFVVDAGYYKSHVPARGELVVIDPPEYADAEGKVFIKRVIAVGGESIQIKDGKVFVNDSLLEEPYILEPIKYDMDETRVSEGAVFVLGDNRNNSDDSHIWGALDIDRVKGKALYIFWPPVRAGRKL